MSQPDKADVHASAMRRAFDTVKRNAGRRRLSVLFDDDSDGVAVEVGKGEEDEEEEE